ncbi:MAG: DUF86 domain-containing protein [Calditrichaeota bacterium]|nr:MAG: DUF86 domain-containing protein [Calditrichota bacterium]
MSPQSIKNKIEQLAAFLSDLQKLENISFEEFQQHRHYEVERLLELLVIYASDILLNIFSQRNEEIPTTLRTTFLRAGEVGILPADLAKRLADAAGMRNLLVHAYAKVNLRIIYDSIRPALQDFSSFLAIISEMNDLIKSNH